MKISRDEFSDRIHRLQEYMEEKKIDTLAVYGDEYRKENLRYVSNFWPIFERGMCFIPKKGDPILAGAPEGAVYAREMSMWDDIRNVKDFACVTVPDEIDYPQATFSSFTEILSESLSGGKRLGLVGCWDIPSPIMNRLKESVQDMEIVEVDSLMSTMRIIKSATEIDCLRECGRIAGIAYQAIMEHSVPGSTERAAAAAGECVALHEGAEAINFHVFGSGMRTHTIIGRPTEKIIEDGDMIMSALAVQYEGYVTTVEFPFVAGKATGEQQNMLSVLIEAANVQQKYLKAGMITGEMVRAVKTIYRKHGFDEFDVYPPMHGIGLAEAESPYPDESSDYPFKRGMCVNSDISLFGHSCGSNRIEEGFVILENGCEPLTPIIRELLENQSI